MKKPLYHWEKHDVVNYLKRNFLEKESEFTTESLIRSIQKLGAGSYFFGYGEKILSRHLHELSQEGHLSVRYVSVQMRPNDNWWTSRKHRFGSKTVAIYKIQNDFF